MEKFTRILLSVLSVVLIEPLLRPLPFIPRVLLMTGTGLGVLLVLRDIGEAREEPKEKKISDKTIKMRLISQSPDPSEPCPRCGGEFELIGRGSISVYDCGSCERRAFTAVRENGGEIYGERGRIEN